MEETPMERILGAARTKNGIMDIDTLYTIIAQHPQILKEIDEVPFIDTPLHVAASVGNIDFAMEMMNLMPSFAKKLNPDGFSPLHLALRNNRRQMVLLLVNANRDLVRVKGRGGMTLLHQAVVSNNLDALAEFLVACPECIVDVTIRGETALHIAARRYNVEPFRIIVHWLIRNTHKKGYIWQDQVLNSKDNEGNTVLHVAAMSRQPHEKIRVLLLNHLTVKNQRNLENLTTLDILQRHQASTQETQRIPQHARGLNAAALPELQTLPGFLQSNISRRELMYVYVVRGLSYLSDQTRSALLVVSGLILTATYQTALNPPGGISQGPSNSTGCFHNSTFSSTKNNSFFKHSLTVDDNPLGKSVMNSHIFIAFYAANTLSYFITSFVILFLISNSPILTRLLTLSWGFFFGCYIYATVIISPTVDYLLIPAVLLLLVQSAVWWWEPWSSNYDNFLVNKYTYNHDQEERNWNLH